ncbi:P-loop containing nucleoside triphosphate hydrolase protein [Catenaria anguillulae PL171]|uniref:p-loop containing nucleoside triphosphate hydrolase protein n=1 Tax=Catenaria anguillulae PL171 TaxID=765915 RepID=A0A1Y2HJW3_9FUNG|nr:P-loop containing nucleoside triphosphate hydrolase protein [Catenaria anguillulae PL171]
MCVWDKGAQGAHGAQHVHHGHQQSGTGKGCRTNVQQGTYTTLSSIERTPGDPLHRPVRKLLLLAGPPGLGKTTLAHVIARHAGYDVTEINASDDRTARTVQDRIAAAMAGATIHQGRVSRRPRLVVIDEIDGAAVSGSASGEGASLVKLLIALAEGNSGGAGPGSKNKKNKALADGKPPPGLRRPIICICNDPYAPALRPLRQMAKVVTVYRPDSHVALVRRLAAIALRENLRVSMQSLHWLAASAEGDIRGCLHALQFASRQVRRPTGANGDEDEDEDEWEGMGDAERERKRAEARRVLITKEMLQKANSASKDGGPRGGLPNVWDAVFSPRAADRLAVDLHVSKQPLTALALAMDRLGDFDKIAVGCLEYAIVAHVPEFDRTAGALDQLVVADKLVAAGYRPGLGGLGHLVHSTVPYALALVHAQFRGGLATLTANDPWTKLAAKQAADSGIPNHGQARLEYPKSDYEAYVRTRDVLNLIQSMRRAAHPRSAVSLMCLQPGTLAMDVFGGPLARILSPRACGMPMDG